MMIYIGSIVSHHLVADPSSSRYVLPLAFLVLLLGAGLNYTLIPPALALEHNCSVRTVFRKLQLGSPLDFFLTQVAAAVLGAMLATFYRHLHLWALLGFLVPIFLARQALVRSQMLLETKRAFHSRTQALTELTMRISDERRDERRLIAADLHDDVLQPLFKVTLMAQVLKADLAHGRLLEMDEDLPELLRAAEIASSTLRELIGDLRRSSLGTEGLTSAIAQLVKGVNEKSSIAVEVKTEPVSVEPSSELVIYQIAKEALSNSVQHSRANNVSLHLEGDSVDVRLIFVDDGVGFDPAAAGEGHYGIQIMRERAASIQGHLSIDSSPGNGCTITLVVPRTSS